MDIQTTPIIPDVEYFLDAALEHGEIDASTHITAKLYAPRSSLREIVDGEWQLGPETLASRNRAAAQLTHLTEQILGELPPLRRGAIAWAGVRHLRHDLQGSAHMLATWAHRDMIVGGCMEPWKRSTDAPSRRRRERYELTPRQHRQMHAADWIRRHVKRSDETAVLRRRGAVVTRRVVGIAPGDVAAEVAAFSADLLAQHEGYRRTNERNIRHFAEANMRPISAPRRDRKRRRRLIAKAAACAEAVLGRDAVHRFATGQPITLAGSQISLEVARYGSAATMGHSGLRVVAIDPQSNRVLANLCVYYEGTPALDQLTALAISMQAGEEAEIIATANLSQVTELGLSNPLIGDRGKPHVLGAWRPRDRSGEIDESYWTATKAVWLDALGVQVLGSRIWKVVA